MARKRDEKSSKVRRGSRGLRELHLEKYVVAM